MNPTSKFRIKGISSFSIIIAFLALSLLGVVLLPQLPVRLSPSNSLPSVTVSFSMPGSSARTVEQEVTSRLESALSTVTGVKSIRSRSRTGGGHVTIELDRNASVATGRFEASMIVRQIWNNMPDNVSYPSVSVRQVDDNASRPFMTYTINADLSPAQIMAYAETSLKPALSRMEGVAAVSLSGANPMVWNITYDASTLTSLGLTSDDIIKAVSSYFRTEMLGIARLSADDGAEWMSLALTTKTGPAPQGSEESEVDLSQIVVTSAKGLSVTLDKIATVKHQEAQPYGYYRINGLNSIYINLTATPEANQIELSRKVKQYLAGVKLPHGFMLTLSYDASERISDELDQIWFRTGLTVLILLIFVALITLSWRYLLVITISLAMTLGVAFVAYWLMGVEIQLYSLAGITISLNLIIDNLIVMAEHITHRHNLRAFPAILAATLTTIGALSVVFFLDEKTLLTLKDFVIVVIINLLVSLFVALLLVPALLERIRLKRRRGVRNRRLRRVPVRLTRGYLATIGWITRHKAIVYLLFILAFGLPVFLLPDKIESESRPAKWYNATIGSKLYQTTLKPWVNTCLGGSLRLFAEKVKDGNYWGRDDHEPVVYINANLPNGATLSQMNALIKKMEVFLAKEDGIRQFHTSISSPTRASITVYFKPEYQRTGYPYRLKSNAVSKALTLGGGSWSVNGLEDNGFSNDVRQSAGGYKVSVKGYNYDDLFRYARSIADTLLNYKRIKEVNIKSDFSFWKDDYTEYYLDFDRERLALDSISVTALYSALRREMGRDMTAASVITASGTEQVLVTSSEKGRDVWGFMNIPIQVGNRLVRLGDYGTIESRQSPPDVVKENQEYVLCVQYEYIGSPKQGDKVLDNVVDTFNRRLPVGYKVEKVTYNWETETHSERYLLLLLIAVIIFFLSSILFNSLRQPMAIIFVIPVSFIGVFLTFYIFDLKFDQGGFAAFILLCGVTVNAAIYIINEYNSLVRAAINRTSHVSTSPVPKTKLVFYSPGASKLLSDKRCKKIYVKAFSMKITAVLLTVLSTILGFIPFLIGDTHESFWFPLAAGTMGGLVFSMCAIFLLLPAIILRTPSKKAKKRSKRKAKKRSKQKEINPATPTGLTSPDTVNSSPNTENKESEEQP